jgi:hypothetical protein
MLDELWQRHLPSFLAMVCQSAEFLRIHTQFPGHLDLRITEMVPLSSVYPNLQVLWNPFLRHVVLPYLEQRIKGIQFAKPPG